MANSFNDLRLGNCYLPFEVDIADRMYQASAEDAISRGRRAVLGYPSLRSVYLTRQLAKEHAGRYFTQVHKGLTSFDDTDTYILDLSDEGDMTEGVPWAVMRYRIDGKVVGRSRYLGFKQSILDANLKSREATLEFATRLLERDWLTHRVCSGTPITARTHAQWERVAEDHQADRRLFDIVKPGWKYPDYPNGIHANHFRWEVGRP